MAFEDLFGDVRFDDAQLNPGDDGGNAGDPPPADDQGQDGASPPPADDQGAAAKDPADDGAKPDKSEDGKEDGKPLPYDQDPKWKKARAAEKALSELLDEHGLLDVEELKEALKTGKSLKEILGDRDAAKLLEESKRLAEINKHWDSEKAAKEREGMSPEEYIAKLEQDNAKLRQSSDEFRTEVEEREHSKRLIEDYKQDIDRVIDSVETPFQDSERDLLRLYLGVDNPANMIDIENRTEVRKMAKESVAKFQTLVQTIKQHAIDEYAAGKSKLIADTTKGSASIQDVAKPKPIPKDASVDDVFATAQEEMLEIITKGIQMAS